MTETIRYSRVINGRRTFEPTAKMKQFGFEYRALGPECENARKKAQALYAEWTLKRRQEKPKSAPPKWAEKTIGYVYFLMTETRVKIGWSSHLTRRAGDLKTGMPDKIVSFVAIAGTQKDERQMHGRLASYRVQGEWFVLAPAVRKVIMRSIAFERPMHDQEEQETNGKVGHHPTFAENGNEHV